MSSVRSGSAMRSSSRRPCRSNRQSSIFSALAEKRAKFVPRPSGLAPRTCGDPSNTCISNLRNKDDAAEWRQRQPQLAAGINRLCRDNAGVADICSTVDAGVAVENFAPLPCARNLDAVVAAYFRREIEHDKA